MGWGNGDREKGRTRLDGGKEFGDGKGDAETGPKLGVVGKRSQSSGERAGKEDRCRWSGLGLGMRWASARKGRNRG